MPSWKRSNGITPWSFWKYQSYEAMLEKAHVQLKNGNPIEENLKEKLNKTTFNNIGLADQLERLYKTPEAERPAVYKEMMNNIRAQTHEQDRRLGRWQEVAGTIGNGGVAVALLMTGAELLYGRGIKGSERELEMFNKLCESEKKNSADIKAQPSSN